MKTNWKTMAAGLALLVGLSGAAFGADRDHDRDRGHNNIRVEQRNRVKQRDHDRQIFRDRDNRAWYWENGRKVYVAPNPYYGYYGPGYYYGNPYRR